MDDLFLSNQELKSSGERLDSTYNSVVQLQNEMRYKSMDFYFRLSLLCGGVISLSITYIGYLSSIPNFVIHFADLLFGGWIVLGLSLMGSLYRNHFNLDMGHWQLMEKLNNARLENDKAALKMMQEHPETFVNLTTVEERTNTIATTKDRISKIEKAIKTSKNNAKHNEKMWLLAQKTSHAGFMAGIILILLFAAFNIPVPIDFTVSTWISKLKLR